MRAASDYSLGGWTDLTGNPSQRATILQLDSMTESLSIGRFGSGPLAFQPDGTPVQLIWEDAQTLVLWNTAQGSQTGARQMTNAAQLC